MDARQNFRFLHHDEVRPCPCDPDEPCAGSMPGTENPFHRFLRGDMTEAGGFYHCSVKTVGRSAGRSVVAAAAYRLGELLHDDHYDQTHDYTRRSGVMDSFTIAPEDAPDWALEPEALWNAAEAAEKRINSTLAREVELALPAFLSPEEKRGITDQFASELVKRYSVAVTVAIHSPGKGDDRNYHAHVLFTTREMTPDGLGKKTRILDDKKTGPQEVRKLRELAADIINRSLAAANSDIRVDHRSFKDRGITQEPTTHLGPSAAEMERRGELSSRGDMNREAAQKNEAAGMDLAERAELDNAIERERQRISEPPRERDEARERVRTDVEALARAVSTRGTVGDIQSGDALKWWQRVALQAAQKARMIAIGITDKARRLWQRKIGDMGPQQSPDDRGRDR